MTRPDRTRLDDPTAENTSDQSTPSASGPGAGRERLEDGVRRKGSEPDPTPRRYEQPTEDDPVMPADDPSLSTKI